MLCKQFSLGCSTSRSKLLFPSWHWKLRVGMMPTLSSLAALQVVITEVPPVKIKLASCQHSVFSDACLALNISNVYLLSIHSLISIFPHFLSTMGIHWTKLAALFILDMKLAAFYMKRMLDKQCSTFKLYLWVIYSILNALLCLIISQWFIKYKHLVNTYLTASWNTFCLNQCHFGLMVTIFM